MKRALLATALLLSSAWSGDAEDCLNDCAAAFLNRELPVAGVAEEQAKAGVTPTVTIYTDDVGRNSHWLREETVQAGADRWNQGCASGDYPGLPKFVVDWETTPENAATRRDVIFIRFRAGEEAEVDGNNTHPATSTGRIIDVFEKCPLGEPHGLSCFGTDFGYIRWNEDWGEQAIAHEIGHVLGLNHDRERSDGCKELSAMAAVTEWGQGNLPIRPHHCELGSRVNYSEELCARAVSSGTHLCEACRRGLGGTVSGLVLGEVATVEAELSLGGQTQTLTTTAFSNRPFNFPGGALEGSDYEVSVTDVSNEKKVCGPVANSSGTVGPDDITDIEMACACNPDLQGGGGSSILAALESESCEDLDPGELHDPREQPEPVLDLCQVYVQFCDGPTLAPWWWGGFGPGTGEGECQRQTTCTDAPEQCFPVPGMEDPLCTPVLNCHDQCSPASTVKLTGPVVGVDTLGGAPVAGTLRLTGFARDEDGLLDFWIYVDGVKVSDGQIEMGLLRPEACHGVVGDCDPFSGFAAELDTTAWTDGPHRLDIVALDAEPAYPMGTRIVREVTVDNACAGTTAPEVALTAPAGGEILVGVVEVTATATAEAGVERVRFYLDGTRTATDWTAPYTWSWDSTTGGDRSYALQAEVLDRCGGSAQSAPVTVETANANEPPVLEVEVPVGGATVQGGTVEVSGWAVDTDAVELVEVRLDGQPILSVSPWGRRSRQDVCDALASPAAPDPDCPDVGFALSFDSTLHPDGWHQLDVLVTDTRGGQSSRSRSVRIANQPPQPPAVTDPVSRQVIMGDDVSFEVSVSGEGPFGYRWQSRTGDRWFDLHDGERGGRVSGAATSRLDLASVALSDAGGYRCRVTNAGGSTPSPSASLSVLESVDAPVATAGIDRTVTEGERAELRVTAEGYPPLSYRWQHWTGSTWADLSNGGTVQGATSPTLALDPVALAHGGQYRCRVTNPGGTTASDALRLSVSPDLSGSCVAGPNVLCLHGQRFSAEVLIDGASGKADPYSDIAGLFTLANPENVEVVVKVLDGVSVNGRYWVFHGSLTSRSYTLTVTDTATGAVRTYFKSSGTFCGGSDTAAFQDPATTGSSLASRVVLLPARVAGASTTGTCTGSLTEVCLLDSRFGVQVFKDGSARRAVGVSPLTGVFTFGSTANPEVVVKVLDGTPVNDCYWVFFGSLTSLDYEVRVTDTASGASKSYPSPGAGCGLADTQAF